MQTEVESGWINYDAASRLTGLGRTTLWRICSDPSSGVKTARIGRAVRINRRSLEDFMEAAAEEVARK